MNNRKTYHVTKTDNGWKGGLAGASRASTTGDTKAEVVQKTIELAKKAPLGQVVIHKENGVIQTEYTYGKDPRKFPG
ncbi:MAG: hypothetical protein B9S32_04645 [Verrucomicrobia bacterium Tous-C9LFEB]|nr:MAG: hypothetical protein B9S32_04645 [Verrucomicrobia bacterium Tous-C9LFEB]